MPHTLRLSPPSPAALSPAPLSRRAWLLGSAAACSGWIARPAQAQAPSAAQTVTLYTSNPKAVVQAALRVIQRQAPQLKVNVVYGGTGELLQRLAAEADTPKADLLWGGAVGLLHHALTHMQPYASPELAAIAPPLVDPQHRWIGSNVHVLGMLVNTRKLRGHNAPETWSDLLDPVWKGRIALADPARSGTAYMLLYGLQRQLGDQALERLASNAVVLPTSSAVHQAVVAGKFAVALTFEYAMQQHLDSGASHIRMLYPSEGSYLVPEGMFLVKGSANLTAARTLYDLLLGKSVQQTLLEQENRRPARTDIALTQFSTLPELSALRIFELPAPQGEQTPAHSLAVWRKAVAAAR